MKTRCLSICMTIMSLLMLTLSTTFTSPKVLVASASATPSPKPLIGYIPSAVSSGQARLVGHHPGTDQLALTIGLSLRNEQALKQFLTEVSTPHNPRYRHYLTQAQANQAFNPTPQQEQQVIAWLKSHGLTVTHTYPNHLLVDVTGTFAQIEQDFHVTINDYTMQLDGKPITFYAPANEPTLDGSMINLIDTILGFDDYPSAQVDTTPSFPARPADNGNPDNSPPYYPQDFANAYDVNPLWNQGDTGTGQSIGIVLWGPPPSSAALQQFDAQTGAQPPNLQVIPVDGGSKHPVKSDVAVEAGMDVEASSSIAPDAFIDYYEAPDTKLGNPTSNGLDDALNMAGTDVNNNQQISNSWYWECEPTQEDAFIQATEQILLSNTATGHDYLFASGDSGSKCGSKNPSALYPATSAYVTSIGGTHFSANIDGRYPKETAWSDSGGGYSILFPEPSWQTNAGIPDPNTMRGFPDIAADADPNTGAFVCYDSSNGPACAQVGGTSLATPLWAGMIADVNQYVQSLGEPPLGFVNPILYVMSHGMPYPAYHDIMKGSNGKYYHAGRGWDAVTGLGSPDLYNLARDATNVDNAAVLSGIAAVSATDVWAVGYDDNANLPSQCLIEQWNGTSWNVVPSPSPGFYNNLFSVAAVSANDVWAVGSYEDLNGDFYTLTEQWNGSGWNVAPSPNPGYSSNLASVAAVSANDVWAVGWANNGAGGADQTLIEQWNGSAWNVVSSPDPGSSNQTNVLTSVAAVSANDVWAVGYYWDVNNQTNQALIEQWNGSSWNVVPGPHPGSGSEGIDLTVVAAVSATDVWAVGSYQDINGNFNTLTEQWNGSSWNVVSSPNPSPYSDSLASVAAVSATDVWAVGTYDSSNNIPSTLIEQWNGTSWNVIPSPSPGPQDFLAGVAAVSATDAWAIGYYFNSNGALSSLIEQWNGSSWNVVASPNPNALSQR